MRLIKEIIVSNVCIDTDLIYALINQRLAFVTFDLYVHELCLFKIRWTGWGHAWRL